MYKSKIVLAASLLLATGSVFAADAASTAAAPAKAAAPAAKPAMAAPASTATAPAKAAAQGSVQKAQFTSGVENHEPKDNLDSLTNDQTRIFFYAVLVNLQGQEVTFRWSYNDVTQAEVKQTPSSGRYRTNTSKTLDPSKLGTWKVEVVDASGNVLTSKTFDYKKADASAAPAAATK
jgi:opacity protein-like surface antigen